jgi:hypothetical protein
MKRVLAAGESATRAAAIRAAIWLLVRLVLVQLLNMRLLLFVHLSLIMQLNLKQSGCSCRS